MERCCETEPENDWQPIETAPQEEWLRAILWDGKRVGEGWLADQGHDDGRLTWSWFEHSWAEDVHPTHWMPLPDPPIEIGETFSLPADDWRKLYAAE